MMRSSPLIPVQILNRAIEFIGCVQAQRRTEPISVGGYEHATAVELVDHVSKHAAKYWKQSKQIVSEQTDPDYILPGAAASLFFTKHFSLLPEAQQLVSHLYNELDATRAALNSHPPDNLLGTSSPLDKTHKATPTLSDSISAGSQAPGADEEMENDGEDSNAREIAVDGIDLTILCVMKTRPNYLWTDDKIEMESENQRQKVSRRTLTERRPDLLRMGLITKVTGKNGAKITAKGLAMVSEHDNKASHDEPVRKKAKPLIP